MLPGRKADDIRLAAQRLFLRSGLRGTSMDAIAAEANVSKQTLYRYYGSKAQLFVAVVGSLSNERFYGHIAELLPAQPLTRTELEDTLVRVARRIVDFQLEPSYLALMRIVIAEVPEFPELARLFRSAVIDRGTAALTVLLTSRHVADLVVVEELAPTLRLFVGPLLSYMLEGLFESPADVKRRANGEIVHVVRRFVETVYREQPE